MKADRKCVSVSKDGTCERLIAACFSQVYRHLEKEMEHQEEGGDCEDAMRCALLLFEVFIRDQRTRLPRQEGRAKMKREDVKKLYHDREEARGDRNQIRELEEAYMKKTSSSRDGMRKALQRFKKDVERISLAARGFDCK